MAKNRKRLRSENSPNRRDANGFSRGRITEPPSPSIQGNGNLPNRYTSLSSEFQLTVRFTYSEVKRKDVSILLAVLNYEAVKFGVSLENYLVMEHLLTFLIGSKKSAWEIKEEKERLTSLTSLIILGSLYGNFELQGDRMYLSSKTQEELQNFVLITSRQYGSLKQSYYTSKFVTIRAVPLKVFYERNENTVRYDSYTRGYKDGGSAAPRSKTRYNHTLDGEDSEPEIEFSILNFMKYQTIQFIDLGVKAMKRTLR